jgi:2-polyprenyl-6-methoxyphenol hydroxylase-like FAD-dependent oxidoreductase
MTAGYDVLTVGGGLGGATLAKALAERGARVLVIEQTREFKDRVRGETMQPWGVADAKALGVYELLRQTCGHEQPWLDMFLGPTQVMHRDLPATTPQAAPMFSFYHPRMQETVLGAAAKAGAEVRRGATVKEVRPGKRPSAVVEQDGKVEEVPVRLVVGADGRSSGLRRWGRFEVKQDPPFLMMAGVLLEDLRTPEDTGFVHINPTLSQVAFIFPQGGGRARAYCSYPASASFRLQGEKDVPRFIEESIRAGMPAAVFEGCKAAGPLASFDAADTWVEHPFAGGVALLGDAAASTDPTWGQGLSLTLRGVRLLRDCLLETTDWEAAGHKYACEYGRTYGVIHEVILALGDLYIRSGPEADARRSRALPLIAQDPMRVPDHVTSGPELPWSEEIRRVFFAEERSN